MQKKKSATKFVAVYAIVATLLMVAMLVMGVTGAWFTSSASSNGETINMRFGAVDYDLTIGTTVKNGNVDAQTTENVMTYELVGPISDWGEGENNVIKYYSSYTRYTTRNEYWSVDIHSENPRIKVGNEEVQLKVGNEWQVETRPHDSYGPSYCYINFYDADGTPNNESGLYVKKKAGAVNFNEVVAGTVVQSQVAIENSSTVDSFYVLVGADNKNYVVNATSHTLVEVTESNVATVYAQAKTGLGALAKGTGISFGTRFTLKNWVGDGSQGAIWTAEYTNDGSTWTALSTPVATASSAIHGGDEIDLGAYLFGQAFSLRAIQASNLPAYGADVLTMLTTNWTTTSAITGA